MSAKEVSQTQIDVHRNHLMPLWSVGTQAECLTAINNVGLVWAFTPGNRLLPSIFPSIKTNSEHQRWDWMWGWKDRIPAARQAYYGKVVGRRPTFVSIELLPVLYALTGNSGDADDDLIHVSQTTQLTEMGRKTYAFLQQNGPTGTRTLMSKLTDGSRPMKNAVEKGIEQLDQAMLIAKVGTEGGNSLANVWDLFPNFMPQAVDAGAEIATREAAVLLLRHFFTISPAVAKRALGGVFPWNPAHQERAIDRLIESGEVVDCLIEGKPGLRWHDFAS